MRICGSSVVLFGTVVREWNASRGQSEGYGLSETNFVVSMVVKESWVIVVVDEDSEGVDILEMLLLLRVAIADAVH